MKKIDLVFRTVGERTSKIALDLAIKNIQPHQVHRIENVKPFSLAVQQMLRINYDCHFVVFLDADCLIMEDITSFLQENTVPYIDCYVLDKFRGQIHCGVHIVRRDLVQAMAKIQDLDNDPEYILRPESRIRDLAMNKLNLEKVFKPFVIFHDFCQFYTDIFIKYALREVRSRTDYQRAKLNFYQDDWKKQNDALDFKVAKEAIAYARKHLNSNASSQELANFIEELPNRAIEELNKRNRLEKPPLTVEEVEKISLDFNIKNRLKPKRNKIFGIGLSQTGTKQLAQELTQLGFNIIHSPDDEVTLKELMAGTYNFSILNDFDGITDITVAPFYAQLDQRFPDSKFILTLRDKESWLRALELEWRLLPVDDLLSGKETNLQRRRLLRVATYGSYMFNRERFSYVYDLHYKNVIEYFKNRSESLLIINSDSGEAWKKLCSFLNQPILDKPFPLAHKII